MKSIQSKLLLAALLCCCLFNNLQSFAQTEVDTSFNVRMNYVFGVLDKQRVPNGMLLDYAMEFTPLNAFSGSGLVDSNYVDYTTLSDIYYTLITSRINSNATGLISPAIWDSLWYVQRTPGTLILSGVYFNYSRFRDDAVSAGKLSISNERFVDRFIFGIWQNPYLTASVFAMAPATDSYYGTNLQILLPSNLWFSNSSGTVSSISIDAADGLGYRTVTQGQALNVNYADTGRKEWKYRLTLTNGTNLYSHSSVLVNADPYASNPQARGATERIEITSPQQFLGLPGRGWMTIDYANTDRIIRRPVIIAEGFDAGHITHPENWWGSQSIADFRDNVNSSGSNNLKSQFLVPNQQYDYIYVDWRIGTDYIQRNGLLLEEVIREVIRRKQPFNGVQQPIILIGQSMGALIGRWALRDMENHGEDHQTGLYVSYDGPHQGANVPLGYQYMARHARSLYVRTGVFPIIELIQLIRNRVSPLRALNIPNTPAARQMLINWVDDNSQVDNSMHNAWQTELRNMGYPNQFGIRVVAVSNGSECALTQPYQPGALLLDYTGKANTRILSDLILAFTRLGTALPILTAFVTGQPAFLLGILPGKNEIKFEFKVNAQPNGTADRIYRGWIAYKKTWLWAIPVQVTITSRSYYANPAILPYDFYPGGQIDDGQNFTSSSSTNFFTKWNITASHIRTFDFIPVPSALDIGSGAVTLTNADYLVRYIGANPPAPPMNSPFQNFITAFNADANNEQHTGIYLRDGDWLADEISGIHPAANCSYICGNSNITLTGPNPVCNIPQVFTVNNGPVGAGINYIWTATPANMVDIVPNGPQATVTRTSGGEVLLQATITSPCGNLVRTLSIRVGGYSSGDYPVTGPSSGSCGSYLYFSTNDLATATSYNWFWPNTWNYSSGQGTRFLTVQIPYSAQNGSNGVVGVRVANACDAGGSPGTKFIMVTCGGFRAIGPNPAKSLFTIALTNTGNVKPEKIYIVKITDQNGVTKKTLRYPGGVTSATIDINDLRPGIYSVQAYNGTVWDTQKLIKQ